MEIKYDFIFDTGRTESFSATLDDSTLMMNVIDPSLNEPWTFLSCHQCEGCPLSGTDNRFCPVARNLAPVLHHFQPDKSFTPVTVRASLRGRIIEKKTALHEGLSALMGLIMATSGCPVLDIFKPMAYTHLPFSSEDETIFRAVSAYLTAQFVRMKHGKPVDWDLSGLSGQYAKVSKLNSAFAERLRELKGSDANVSALILLDVFAQFGSFALNDEWVGGVKNIFSAYLAG